MKKTLKKTLALVLSMLMLLSVFSVASGAVKLSEGLDALRAQWSRDCGPSAGGYAIDYSYYSPVKSASDSTKYPLVVFLPGGGEGKKPGGELTGNSFARWSSEELQARFTSSGGAFLMIARDPEEKLLYWDASSLIPGLKAAIDDFAQKHPNVDTSRIYVIGWCLGATGALNLAVNYSNSIAGVVLCSPRCSISSSDAVKLKNTAVWILSCKKDSYSLYSYSQTSWSNLKENSADKSKIRFTSFDSAPNAGG
ncbi:MAG: serine aminopeptidase domain-containing protein, partial [Acutalibacteraceae bacterium]